MDFNRLTHNHVSQPAYAKMLHSKNKCFFIDLFSKQFCLAATASRGCYSPLSTPTSCIPDFKPIPCPPAMKHFLQVTQSIGIVCLVASSLQQRDFLLSPLVQAVVCPLSSMHLQSADGWHLLNPHRQVASRHQIFCHIRSCAGTEMQR